MALVSPRFTTSVPSVVSARLERAARNAPPIRHGEPVRGAVRAIQQALLDLGDPRFFMTSGADGIFGSETACAVREFQKVYGLTADGVMGAQTLTHLDSLHAPEINGCCKGISLHFGLNAVDPNHYEGWDGALGGCEPDARDMKTIADAQGFTSKLLLTREATSQRLLSELRSAAEQLGAGDILLLSYSGHGGQVPNTNGDDESDGKDETWCMYDREVVDDELFAAFARFAPGVRLLVLSDSCHSGTVTRMAEFSALAATARTIDREAPTSVKPRAMPPEVGSATYKAHQDLYDSLQLALPTFERSGVEATVLLISGCQDHQLSGDTGSNGVFTNGLKRVWEGGQFDGNYRTFHARICSILPSYQQPNLFIYGKENEGFVGQKPFAV
jgi:metacaspase-1